MRRRASRDYDNDGFDDVYITAFGPNVLWRNTGQRARSPMSRDRPASATRDGAPAARSATTTATGTSTCTSRTTWRSTTRKIRSAARLAELPLHGDRRLLRTDAADAGDADVLYRNNGDGTFTDVTEAARRHGSGRYYGFGVLFTDLDDDGWPDIFVANDSVPNFLFRNNHDGTFVGARAAGGVALSGDGPRAGGHGRGRGDYNGDGRLDLDRHELLARLHTLYENRRPRACSPTSATRPASPIRRWAVSGLGRRLRRRRQRRPARYLHRQRPRLSRGRHGTDSARSTGSASSCS